jgi:hypothetical protein
MQPKDNNNQYPGIPENFPCISIIIPFELKMSTTAGLHAALAVAISREEAKLRQSFSEKEATPVIAELHRLVRNLDGNPNQMSIGIFVSPHASRIYYFNYSDTLLKNDREGLTG